MNLTPAEILEELRRELKVRRQVYPNWVALRKLGKKTAAHRIAAIEGAIELLEKQCPLEQAEEAARVQLDLFGGGS